MKVTPANEMDAKREELDTLLVEPFNKLSVPVLERSRTITKRLKELNPTMNHFTSNSCVTFLMYRCLSETVLSGLLVDEISRKRLKSMGLGIKTNFRTNPNPFFKPKCGDLVACNEAYRGIVLHEPTLLCDFYKVFLIDCGYVGQSEEVDRLSPSFETVPFSAVLCTIISSNEKNKRNMMSMKKKFRCDLKSVYSNECSGILYDFADKAGLRFEVRFRPYLPKEDLLVLPPFQFSGKSPLVKVASFETSRNCYIRAGDEESEEIRLRLLDCVNYTSLKSNRLNQNSLIGDVVAAPYKNSYWRAVVEKVHGSKYLVNLVDKGIQIHVAPESLKELPLFLKLVHRTTEKVKLSNVRIIEKNKLVEKFLKQRNSVFKLSVNKEKEIVLNFLKDDQIFVEGVSIDKRNSVNEHIHNLLEPHWLTLYKQDCLYEQRKIIPNDLMYGEWKVGSFKLLRFVGKEGELLSVADEESDADTVYDEMNLEKRFQEFVSCFDDPYVPNLFEVCLARESKSHKWERALCIKKENGGEFLMHLLESGLFASVEHTDLRRLHNCFLKYPVGVKLVEVQNPDQIDLTKLLNIPNGVWCEIIYDEYHVCEINIPDLERL